MKNHSTATALHIVVCSAMAAGFLNTGKAHAQAGISAAYHTTVIPTTGHTYTGGAAPDAQRVGSNNKTYYYGNLGGPGLPTAEQLQSFQTTNSTYSYYIGQSLPIQVFIRRQSAPPAGLKNVDLLYYEGTINTATTEIRTSYPYYPKMEDNFAHRYLGMGTDNLFTNETSQVNHNAIERVDAIMMAGYTAENTAAAGFAILERGASTSHDACVVGIVTAIDGNGTPTAYATKFIQVGSNDYYTTANIYGGNTADYFVARRNVNTNDPLLASNYIENQGIGGIYFSFADFDLPNNTTIYGYSIFPVDFFTNSDAANRAIRALSWTNTAWFPNNTSEANGGIDLSMVAGIVKKMVITGSIHHDANGLNNAAVDGPAIYNPANTPLYVYLINPATNLIIAKVPVANDGTYTIDKTVFGNLQVVLSSNGSGTEGGTWNSSLQQLPAGWAYAGEDFGLHNASGTGIKDGSGSGANAPSQVKNGIIAISVTDRDVTEVKFGIQQPPVADPKEYQVSNSAFSAFYGSPGAGFPAVSGFRYLPMNSTGLSATNTGTNGSLSGTDAEDCAAAGSCNGHTGTRTTFNVTTINSNTQLWYDFGTANGGVQRIVPNTATAVIPNFDYNKLVIYGQLGTGDATDPLTFNYTMTDAAGAVSPPVTYRIITADPLPLDLISFNGYILGQHTVLDWITVREENVSHFEILRSDNGDNWHIIGNVQAHNTLSENRYGFEDRQPASGINLYKLQMKDLDGSSRYSPVVKVMHSLAIPTGIIVAPNPFGEMLTVILPSAKTEDKLHVNIYDSKGTIVHNTTHQGNGSLQMDVRFLASGTYYLEVKAPQGVFTEKIVKP